MISTNAIHGPLVGTGGEVGEGLGSPGGFSGSEGPFPSPQNAARIAMSSPSGGPRGGNPKGERGGGGFPEESQAVAWFPLEGYGGREGPSRWSVERGQTH